MPSLSVSEQSNLLRSATGFLGKRLDIWTLDAKNRVALFSKICHNEARKYIESRAHNKAQEYEELMRSLRKEGTASLRGGEDKIEMRASQQAKLIMLMFKRHFKQNTKIHLSSC
jgi:hypothetical protein